jgi:carbamoyl-phosphate synthase/aspartate carbamoyltransferase
MSLCLWNTGQIPLHIKGQLSADRFGRKDMSSYLINSHMALISPVVKAMPGSPAMIPRPESAGGRRHSMLSAPAMRPANRSRFLDGTGG